MSIHEERYTFTEIASQAHVSISTVWRWHLKGVKGRKLESKLIGGRRFVTATQKQKFFGEEEETDQRQIRRNIAEERLRARGV